MRSLCAFLIVALLLPNATLLAAGQTTQQTATTTVVTPVFASRNVSEAPLRVAKEGSVLLLLDADGDWCHIEFQDPQYGRRSGYVQTKYVRIDRNSVPQDETPVRLAPPSPASVVAAPAVREPGHAVGDLGEETRAAGMLDGEAFAEGLHTGGKVGTGVALGVLTGLIGTGIGYFVIGPETMNAEALQRNLNKNAEYQLGFQSGWNKKTQSKKRQAFLVGGLLGTAAFVAILVSANSRTTY